MSTLIMNVSMTPIAPAAAARAPAASNTVTAPAELDLDTYTDTEAMRALLQQHLPGFADGRLRLDALGVCMARRNASRRRNPCPIVLCYELQVSDLARGHAGTQMLYAKVYRAGQAEPHYLRQDRSLLTRPAFGEALVHLPRLNLVLWALPNDPGLPQLAMLLDPAQAQRGLPWAALGAACAEFGTVEVKLLRYEPECRATLRYTLTRLDGSGTRALYAKTFCDARAQDIHQRFEHFWQLAQTNADAPLVAQPLGYCAATQTLWQAPASGMPLLQMLDVHNGTALIGRVARALALLHAAPLAPSAGAAPRSAAHWVAEARRRQKKISRADPAMAARAACVADAIAAYAKRQQTRPLSLIHGDFHPEQIWVHQGRIVLFDFDEFTLGDPMEDLAQFVLKLEQACIAAELCSVLIEQYAACAPGRFDRRGLAWHLTVQSLLQASRAFVFQKPGWAGELDRRLARSETRAANLITESAS